MRMHVNVHLAHFDGAVAVDRKLADESLGNFLNDVEFRSAVFSARSQADSSISAPKNVRRSPSSSLGFMMSLLAICVDELGQIDCVLVIGSVPGHHDTGPWNIIPNRLAFSTRELDVMFSSVSRAKIALRCAISDRKLFTTQTARSR